MRTSEDCSALAGGRGASPGRRSVWRRDAGQPRRTEPARRPVGATARAQLNLIAWAGYVERGDGRPGLRLGHAVRDGDRLQGQHDGHDRLGRGVSA